MIEELNLVNVVSIDCITSRVEALEIMARSRILFLFSVDQPLQIPVKLYEYIGLHSYVLAECDEAGAALNILRQYPRSEIVPPGNIEKMKEAIIKLFNARNDRSADNLSSFQFSKFERKELAGQLAEALNKRLVS